MDPLSRLLLLWSLLAGNAPGSSEPRPAAPCDAPFFARIGDLAGDAHYSEARDLDHRGVVLVGESWADDPLVPNDGLSTWAGTGPWPHAYQAAAYAPSCAPPAALGHGLTGLGYSFPTDRAESVANGVAPDGRAIVGWCNTGAGVRAEAVVFRPDGTKALLGKLPGHQSSAATEVSGLVRRVARGGGPAGGPGGVQPGGRVIVGYSSLANEVPQKAPGAEAVYWSRNDPAQALPLPGALPNGAALISSGATAISDDARTIAGNLYYDGPAIAGVRLPGFPCVWELQPDGTYGAPVVLEVLPSGLDDGQAFDVSGNGLVAVGLSSDVSDPRACAWRKLGGVWTLTALDVLPGMSYSLALAVDHGGLVAVGTSGFFDDVTFDFGLRPVRWTLAGAHPIEDLQPLLALAYPGEGIDDGWLIEATAISGDGRIVAGRMNFPAPTPEDPYAVLDEGWIARLP